MLVASRRPAVAPDACARAFDLALEFADDAREMPVHRGARRVGIVRFERGDDRARGPRACARAAPACGSALRCASTADAHARPTAGSRRHAARRCRSPARSSRGTRDRPTRAGRDPRRWRACGPSISRSTAISRRRIVRAASAAISPSMTWRAASRSNGPGASSAFALAVPTGGAPSFGAAQTKMPVPTRTSTRPASSRQMIASRTDVRDTPSTEASSRSAGRRAPGDELALVDQRCDLVGDLPVQPRRLDGGEGHIPLPCSEPQSRRAVVLRSSGQATGQPHPRPAARPSGHPFRASRDLLRKNVKRSMTLSTCFASSDGATATSEIPLSEHQTRAPVPLPLPDSSSSR